MGYYCTVPQCTSLAGKTKNVKFHRFPRDDNMANKWNSILKRGKPFTKYSKVCSLHFTQSDYNVTTMGQWKTLSKDAVPSQNLPKLNPDGTLMVIRKTRTVKYREGKKDECDKQDKWIMPARPQALIGTSETSTSEPMDTGTAFRLQTLSAIASCLPPHQLQVSQTSGLIQKAVSQSKPKKQDAFMQTDPVQCDDDKIQPNNSYSESETSYSSEQVDYQSELQFKEKQYCGYQDKGFDSPKDYSKAEDYIPQTNEEYNKEAEKYALERKSLNNGFEKLDTYQKPLALEKNNFLDSYSKSAEYQKNDSPYQKSNLDAGFQKADYPKLPENYQKSSESFKGTDYQKGTDSYQKGESFQKEAENYQKLPENYQKIPDVYTFQENERARNEYLGYQNGYQDSVEMLRNQQHNLQMLQEQHRIMENQNFFNENSIKQENLSEDDKFLYERSKEQLESNSMYNRNLIQHQVKQEPEATGSDSVLTCPDSPYYANGHNNLTGSYYDQLARPGPELLIAKQNALAAHTQLWHNTMKRPFFYSETPLYSGAPVLRCTEDLTRILQ